MVMEGQEKKIQVAAGQEEDETCQTFVIRDEDHTLGNSLRYIVLKNPEVQFCGYSIPHPSENKMNFRIQTKGSAATEVLKKGLKDLHNLSEHVLNTFEKNVKSYTKLRRHEESMEDD